MSSRYLPHRLRLRLFPRLLPALVLLSVLALAGCGFEVPDVVSAADAKEGVEETGPTTWSGPGFVSVNDVAVTPFGLVAVGSDVWLSPNGRDWERLFLDDMQGEWGGSVMSAVAWDGRRLVAVGQRRSNNSVWGSAAVWFSADGRSWRAVPNDGALSASGAVTMTDIAIGVESGRMVAVGESANYFDSNTPDVEALAWTSTDGIDWTQAELPNNRSESDVPISIKSVVSTPLGFAAAGTHLWTTQNGIDWQVGASAEAGFPGATDIVVTPQVQSALGQPAWRSTNGVDWFTIENSVAPTGLRASATSPSGAVAFAEDSLGRYTPYVSPDGLDWTPQDGSAFQPGDRVNAVTSTLFGWVAVGSSGDKGRVWTGNATSWQLITSGNEVIEPPSADRIDPDRDLTGLIVPDAEPTATTETTVAVEEEVLLDDLGNPIPADAAVEEAEG